MRVKWVCGGEAVASHGLQGQYVCVWAGGGSSGDTVQAHGRGRTGRHIKLEAVWRIDQCQGRSRPGVGGGGSSPYHPTTLPPHPTLPQGSTSPYDLFGDMLDLVLEDEKEAAAVLHGEELWSPSWHLITPTSNSVGPGVAHVTGGEAGPWRGGWLGGRVTAPGSDVAGASGSRSSVVEASGSGSGVAAATGSGSGSVEASGSVSGVLGASGSSVAGVAGSRSSVAGAPGSGPGPVEASRSVSCVAGASGSAVAGASGSGGAGASGYRSGSASAAAPPYPLYSFVRRVELSAEEWEELHGPNGTITRNGVYIPHPDAIQL